VYFLYIVVCPFVLVLLAIVLSVFISKNNRQHNGQKKEEFEDTKGVTRIIYIVKKPDNTMAKSDMLHLS
jgi:uncharacterized membrane protein